MIVYPDKSFKSLINSKCVYSIKFFEDTIFSKLKCKVKPEGLKELKNIIEKND